MSFVPSGFPGQGAWLFNLQGNIYWGDPQPVQQPVGGVILQPVAQFLIDEINSTMETLTEEDGHWDASGEPAPRPPSKRLKRLQRHPKSSVGRQPARSRYVYEIKLELLDPQTQAHVTWVTVRHIDITGQPGPVLWPTAFDMIRLVNRLIFLIDEAYAEDFQFGLGEFAIGIQRIPPDEQVLQGGCTSARAVKRSMEVLIESCGRKMYAQVYSARSNYNDCFFHLLRQWTYLLPPSQRDPNVFQKYNIDYPPDLRSLIKGLPPAGRPVGLLHLQAAAMGLECNIQVYDNEFNILGTYGDAGLFKRSMCIMLEKEHWWLFIRMPSFTPIVSPKRKRQEPRCTACGLALRANHRCGQLEKQHLDRINQRLLSRDVKLMAINQRVEEESMKELTEGLVQGSLSCFIHGSAGTGKSWIIEKVLVPALELHMSPKCIALAASTGVAALEVAGMRTLHSMFCLGKGDRSVTQVLETLHDIEGKVDHLLGLRVLVVDEVSMVTEKTWKTLDAVLRLIRKIDSPFGGLSMCFVGDFLQLPPVKSNVRLFQMRDLWREMEQGGLLIHNLTVNRRFEGEKRWFALLGRFRQNSLTAADVRYLRSMTVSTVEEARLRLSRDHHPRPAILCGLKATVKRWNDEIEKELHNERAQAYTLRSEIKHINRWQPVQQGTRALSDAPIDAVLRLHCGTTVMINSNVYMDQGLGNGSLCTFKGLVDKGAILETASGHNVIIKQHEFSVYGREYRGYCFSLAHAITIHKSQGTTMDAAIVVMKDNDSGRQQIFEASQAYVALSRVRSPRNLVLVGFNPQLGQTLCDEQCKLFSMHCSGWEEAKRPQWVSPVSETFLREGGNNPNSVDEGLNLRIGAKDHVGSALRNYVTNHGDKGDEERLLFNTVFYDLETCPDIKTKEEKVYMNYMLVYEEGKVVDEVEICAMCEEVNVMEATVDYLLERVTKQCDEYLKKKDMMMKSGEGKAWLNLWSRPLYLLAYNGSGFDFHFFMRRLMQTGTGLESRYEISTVMKAGKIIRMTLWDRMSQRFALRTHDLCNLLTCSLKKAAKGFLGQDGLQKDVFPHLYMNTYRVKTLRESASGLVELKMADFPSNQHQQVSEAFTSRELACFPLHEHAHKYCKLDVYVLRDLYLKKDETARNMLGESTLRFDTTAQETWYGWLLHLDQKYLQKGQTGPDNRRPGERISKIHTLTHELDKELSSACFGGRVLPRISSYESKDKGKPYDEIEDYYIDADVSAMYGSILKDRLFPYGVETHIKSLSEVEAFMGRYSELSEWEPTHGDAPLCLLKCSYILNRHQVEPSVPCRNEEGRLEWSVRGERHGWLTSVDYYLVRKNKAERMHIHEIVHWPNKGRIFESWMAKCLSKKQSAKKEGNTAMESYCKLMGNSVFGGVLKKDHPSMVVWIRTLDDLRNYHKTLRHAETLNWRQWSKGDNNVLVCKGERNCIDDLECTGRPRYLGYFVLSYSRLMLDGIFDVTNPWRLEGSLRAVTSQVLYGDTDSILVHSSALPRLLRANLIGNEPGQLGCDLNKHGWRQVDEKTGEVVYRFAKITDYRGPAPKLYALKARMPDNSEKESVRMKGIATCGFEFIDPLSGQIRRKMDYETFRCIHDGITPVPVDMGERLLRNGLKTSVRSAKELFQIDRERMVRTLNKRKWKGRYWLPATPHLSIPLGFEFK
jgi:ATP-dependent DNA helicase PIF1